MRNILSLTVILALSATQIMAAYPINIGALQARDAVAARRSVDEFYSQFSKRHPQGGEAHSGSSGDASGGDVENDGDTVSNTGGSCT